MMRLGTLCVIATLATTSCAPAIIARGPATLPIPMPGDNSDPEDEWFAIARKIWVDGIKTEAALKLDLIDCAESRDVALERLGSAEAVALDATSGVGGFLKVWGLPLGLFIGLVGGGVIAYGAAHK